MLIIPWSILSLYNKKICIRSEYHGILQCRFGKKSNPSFRREKMIPLFRMLLLTVGLILVTSLYALAADCPNTPWQTLPNYVPGHGTPCELVGLDTHRGICEPGHQFETRCDDASGGRYKICQGPRRCIPDRPVPIPPIPDCTRWDYRYNQPCQWGMINSDCRGDCETRMGTPYPDDCTKWNFKKNHPCAPGRINTDCRGNCETRIDRTPYPDDCTKWNFKKNHPCAPGRINTDCRGNCETRIDRTPYPGDCTKWNFKKNHPCAPGRVNTDCRGNCETRIDRTPYPGDCQNWDYDKNRPCPPGYINRDCHGSCGRR